MILIIIGGSGLGWWMGSGWEGGGSGVVHEGATAVGSGPVLSRTLSGRPPDGVVTTGQGYALSWRLGSDGQFDPPTAESSVAAVQTVVTPSGSLSLPEVLPLRRRWAPDPSESVEAAPGGGASVAWETGGGSGSPAEQRLRERLHRMPEDEETRLQLAARYWGRGQKEVAMALLEEGVAHHASVALAGQAAHYRSAVGDGERAVALLHRVVEILGSPGALVERDVEGAALLAAWLHRGGRNREAAAWYELLVRRDPGQAPWWLGLALATERNADPVGAVVAYRQALAAGGLSGEVVQYVRECLVRLAAGPDPGR